MPSRILIIALLCAGIYAALLGAHAGAQEDPTPTSTPTTAPVADSPAPSPSATATSTPADLTDSTPTPFPSPVETVVASPAATESATPEATVTADPTAAPTTSATPTATATPKHRMLPRRKRAKKNNVDSAEGCLSSTSSRGCKKVEPVKHEPQPTVPKVPTRPLTRSNGTPTASNPTVSLATPGPAAVGVPNFFIDKFRIPPFLLPIYQAAGTQYGIRWEVLAAINEIETDYGRNLNISSAGALGWMQFMPATWKSYGVDANDDGLKDPFNPVDAIFAAARYLRAAGGDKDIRRAVFAYNHADWYVDSVLLRARVIGGLPADLVGSLTGLTQGYFPVRAKASYAGKLEKASRRVRRATNAAYVVQGGTRRGIDIYARAGAPAIAVNDGRIVKIGQSKRLGRYVQLQDVYGNTYTYGGLKTVARTYPAPKKRKVSQAQVRKELHLPKHDPKPSRAASAGTNTRKAAPAHASSRAATSRSSHAAASRSSHAATSRSSHAGASAESVLPAAVPDKQRLFAHPARPAARAAGGDLQIEAAGYSPSFGAGIKFNARDFEPKRLRKGARVLAGTVLGRLGRTSSKRAPHLRFEIRPAGRGAPRVDPKPILDGWKLLESTAIYRAAGKNPFFGADAEQPSIGQVMLMSKEALARHVLANPNIDIYACGRHDIQTGQIDRRVLATLEFLASNGLKPTVSSLKCGHGYLTSSGNVSEHTTGTAVDIAAINGTPIVGHQGKGSITDLTIQRLLTLQGSMKPHQIISLMTFDGADNTLALPDHYDHIHVGFRPLFGDNAKASKQVAAVLKPKQWIKLIDRLGEIDNPTVRATPSKYATRTKRGSAARAGD
jgi:murein DD-endopeptidase MepM/ murein hydrolase activator NlpD